MQTKLPVVADPVERGVGQRTAWLDPRVNPVRVGTYEVRWRYDGHDDILFFNRWDGRRWHWGSVELSDADMKIYAPARRYGNPKMVGWRGLCLPNAVSAERERCAKWLETQRDDVPATGAEFAADLRNAP